MESYTSCFSGNLTEETLTSFARMTLNLTESQLDDDMLSCFMLYMVMTLDTDRYRQYKAQRLIEDKMGPNALTQLIEIAQKISDKDLSACHTLLPQYSAFVESIAFETEPAIARAVISTPLPVGVHMRGACCAAALLVSIQSSNIPLRQKALSLAAKELNSDSFPVDPDMVRILGYNFLESTSMHFLLTIPQELYYRHFGEFERYLECQLSAV